MKPPTKPTRACKQTSELKGGRTERLQFEHFWSPTNSLIYRLRLSLRCFQIQNVLLLNILKHLKNKQLFTLSGATALKSGFGFIVGYLG